jgi:AraC-like DNA-binding protein
VRALHSFVMVPLRLVVGTDRIALAGALPEVTAHHHAAAAIVVGIDAPIVVIAGRRHATRAAVLAPGFTHALDVTATRLAVFVQPPTAGFACGPAVRDLAHRASWVELARALVDGELADLEHVDRLVAREQLAVSPIDARVARALDLMTSSLHTNLSIAELAAAARLSPSRLMALAREQLGTSLRGYRRWLRAFHVARAYADGASLTSAAHAAGFASSAHLSAAAREHFGIRPSHVLNPSNRATISLR